MCRCLQHATDLELVHPLAVDPVDNPVTELDLAGCVRLGELLIQPVVRQPTALYLRAVLVRIQR